jgi:hypothetical protein
MDRNEPSAIPTNESYRSVWKTEPGTGPESTADAVNQKAGVAFGRKAEEKMDWFEGPEYSQARTDGIKSRFDTFLASPSTTKCKLCTHGAQSCLAITHCETIKNPG